MGSTDVGWVRESEAGVCCSARDETEILGQVKHKGRRSVGNPPGFLEGVATFNLCNKL